MNKSPFLNDDDFFKSNSLNDTGNLIKAKYIKRTGTPGNYRYVYAKNNLEKEKSKKQDKNKIKLKEAEKEKKFIKEFLEKYPTPEKYHESQIGKVYKDFIGRPQVVRDSELDIRNSKNFWEAVKKSQRRINEASIF